MSLHRHIRRAWEAIVPHRVGPMLAALHRHALLLLGTSTLLVLSLGIWGFARHADSLRSFGSWLDLFYLSVQLFVLQSGAVPDPVPWQLEIARFTAPVVALGAALGAVAALFFDQVQYRALAWFGRDHVVVCGLGRKGAHLVAGLTQQGGVGRRRRERSHQPGPRPVPGTGCHGARWLCLRRAEPARGPPRAGPGSGGGGRPRRREHRDRRHRPRALHRPGRHGAALRCPRRQPQAARPLARDRERVAGGRPVRPRHLQRVRCRRQRDVARAGSHPTHRAPPHLLILGFGNVGENVLVRALKDWCLDRPSSDERLSWTQR